MSEAQDDFIAHLELIFGAKIVHMRVDTTFNSSAAQFQLGYLYHFLGTPTVRLHLTLSPTLIKQMTKGHRPSDIRHVFELVTKQAHITSVHHEPSMTNIGPQYKVELTIIDYDEFKRDIANYHWNTFNAEFTQQLEEVLEE